MAIHQPGCFFGSRWYIYIDTNSGAFKNEQATAIN